MAAEVSLRLNPERSADLSLSERVVGFIVCQLWGTKAVPNVGTDFRCLGIYMKICTGTGEVRAGYLCCVWFVIVLLSYLQESNWEKGGWLPSHSSLLCASNKFEHWEGLGLPSDFPHRSFTSDFPVRPCVTRSSNDVSTQGTEFVVELFILC